MGAFMTIYRPQNLKFFTTNDVDSVYWERRRSKRDHVWYFIGVLAGIEVIQRMLLMMISVADKQASLVSVL